MSSSVHALPFAKETMSARDLSFEEILEETPTLAELCEHVRIGTKWYVLGIMLELGSGQLQNIEMLPKDLTYKTLKMFELWLNNNLHPTRRQLLDALNIEVIGENSMAHEYEQTLKNSCSK